MKKLASLMMASILVIGLLAGCDSLPGNNSDGPAANTPPSDSSSPAPSTPSSPESSAPAAPADDYAYLDEGEYEEGGDWGYQGDVMHTYWFNFAVESAYTTSTYGDYTAEEGKQILVVNLAMKNTVRSSVGMTDIDFQAQWNDDADDAYAWPITTDEPWTNQVQVDHQLTDEQLPVQYDIPVNSVKTGQLAFVVPAEMPDGTPNRDFSISFEEVFQDDSIEGDVYFVYFTAEEQ